MDFRDILTKKMEAQGTPEDRNRQDETVRRTVRQNPQKPMCPMAHPAYFPYLFREWLFDEGGIANREA